MILLNTMNKLFKKFHLVNFPINYLAFTWASAISNLRNIYLGDNILVPFYLFLVHLILLVGLLALNPQHPYV